MPFPLKALLCGSHGIMHQLDILQLLWLPVISGAGLGIDFWPFGALFVLGNMARSLFPQNAQESIAGKQ